MKIILCDIDGTVCDDIKNEDSHLYPTAKVIEGSLEQINKWFDEGNHITFFTAREEKDRLDMIRKEISYFIDKDTQTKVELVQNN